MKRIVLSACPNVDGTKWLSLPGHLTQMVYSIAWVCCTCCRCWRGSFGLFFLHHLSFSFSLSAGRRSVD